MTPSPAEPPATEPREKKGGRVVVLMVLGLALLFGGAYVAAYFAAGDKVPHGTTVAGVAIGGMSRGAATATLEAELAARAAAPIDVSIDDQAVKITPEQAGLAVDYAASAAAAGSERSWSPSWLWSYFTGGGEVAPVVTVDDTAMESLIGQLTQQFGGAPVDGAVTFRRGEVKVRDPLTGKSIDAEATRSALTEAFLDENVTVELTPVVTDPEITADDVQQAVDEFANPAVSGPVTLVFGKSRVVMRPEKFTRAVSLEPVDGALVPSVDTKRLTRLVDRSISGDGAPVDATVRLVDGKPKVIPAKAGVTYKDRDVTDAFLGVVTKGSGEREVSVDSTVAEPEFTTADARKLQIKERVSSFTTYYPYAEYRNTNIGRAAELVNGSLLKPGETFSLNDTVGERTRENGFTEGFIISDGIFKEDLGGGVSQMATTTFNAMFFAGLKDVEHKTHSFYIDRYPVGREATVAWGSVDLRFQNDTPYGVLIQASVTPSTPTTQGVVTVSMWSTKYWDITTTTGDRYNLTKPKTRTLTTKDCYPNTGYGGFDIDIVRYFRKPGETALDHSETMHTHYTPSDTVICKPPPTP